MKAILFFTASILFGCSSKPEYHSQEFEEEDLKTLLEEAEATKKPSKR